MPPRTDVSFSFDLVSPYSWLALARARSFAEEHDVAWVLEPVVYGVLLDHHGLVGPVETEAKRRYTFTDVARCAALDGRRLVGPPQHPFRSLAALRTVVLFRDDPKALDLALSLADAAWSAGRDLADFAVLEEIVESVGLPASALEGRVSAPEVKERLRASTEAAIAAGVFGVPTFRLGSELFWGQDRLPHLAARLRGELGPVEPVVSTMLTRPAGAWRSGARGPRP